ncbi:HAD-IIB family hydrolase [Bacillus sp. 3255]|uniref:HAD-IIB family hydrolase n=1 Tax=Bacillus sp. 3255 TaxID=2817904 RepID=UPI002864F9BD|nr:HAD-IIB family hydrolase [Bacillus sp. 3255]MDR6879683.1 Cof subfamily protein (haloacid dehalogenase superfamily) [Bacillus sp. 3255]
MKDYFLTDLDGTLLRSNATLSEHTARVVTKGLEEGAVISYATARSYQSSMAVASQIPWRYPLVLYNGALLFDPIQKRVMDGFFLDRTSTEAIVAIGRTMGLVPLLFALDHEDRERVLHEKLVRSGDLQFAASRPGDPRFTEVKALSCPENYRTLLVTYIGMLEEVQPLRDAIAAALGSKLHIHMMKDNYIADHYFLEFSHPQANKREGLLLWAEHVRCSCEEITVFGDNLNDVGMFQAAGRKIAVANAHPDLLQLATEIAARNDQDGVAQYLEARLRNGV